jgi:hypothetical protein
MGMNRQGKLIAAAVIAWGFGATAASANCPTPKATGATAKYIAIYNRDPQNAGSSWRFYIRPRKGACLEPSGTGFQSPHDTPGQSNGSKKSAAIHPGSKNCSAKYKSYISVDVPSAQAVYDTFTTYKTDDGKSQPTIIGWSVANTLAKGPTYDGAIFVAPMMKADKTPSNTEVQIVGVCIQ